MTPQNISFTNTESTFAGITILLIVTGVISAFWSISLISFDMDRRICQERNSQERKPSAVTARVRFFTVLAFLSFLTSTITCGPARFIKKQNQANCTDLEMK